MKEKGFGREPLSGSSAFVAQAWITSWAHGDYATSTAPESDMGSLSELPRSSAEQKGTIFRTC